MMRYFLLIIVLVCTISGTARAAHIQEVTSKNGIKAWLVEDHKLPVMAMHFAFRGGVEQDPIHQQGLATLVTDMLTEGAGSYDASAFQQQLADHSIKIDFSAGRDSLSGSMKTLSADRKDAFDVLHMALTEPRFDTKDFERKRSEQLAAIRNQFSSPDWQARYGLFSKIFANHPYGERRLGTTKTLARITREDAKNFIASHMAQDNLVVAVAGDISAADLAIALDQVFDQLPRHAHVAEVKDVAFPMEPTTILIPREGTQTELLFAMAGPQQTDPEWYAVEIANYILGGGGFSSRLMQEVRDKKGLTYGIGTSLSPAEHAGLIVGEAATDNSKTNEAWDIVQTTMHHFYEGGVTPVEITAAKDYLTGSSALELTSTDRIATKLVELQLQHRAKNYLDKYNDLVRKVTAEDVEQAIHHWFNPDRMTLSMVGKPDGMTPTETRSLMRE